LALAGIDMGTEDNLLFGTLALQMGLIDAGQFIEACKLWSQDPGLPIADLLVKRGWLLPGDKSRVEHLLHAPRSDGSGTVAFAPESSGNRPAEGPSERPAAAAPPTPASPVGPTSDSGERYAPRHIHAAGGMGLIWLARDTQLDRDVALKELHPKAGDDVVLRSRFLREAQITGQLEHPGVVPVYEVARHPRSGLPFYTMRFVRGRTLTAASEAFHARRRDGQAEPLELVALLSAFVVACNTIAYAHSRRILHRDLKGENVILGDFGEVVVLDWGLAKQLDAPEATDAARTYAAALERWNTGQTLPGDVIGTPAYMAPEQASGRVDLIDHRTDIYGLGAILYEILTGQPPFTGSDSLEVVTKAARGEPARPRELWPEVPAALESTCLRALARDPANRHATAAHLAREVQTWQEVQRRQAEDALRRQTEILQSILNSMSEGVVVADEAGRYLLINPAGARVAGPGAIGETLPDATTDQKIFLPDQVTPCPSEDLPLMRAIRGQAVDDAELFLRDAAHPDGIWLGLNARPLRDEQGELKGGVVVFRDVTERKRAEEELRRSRERFELAVAGSQDGLWDWDLETDVVYFSPRWKSILGYEDHEITNHLDEWIRRLHPDEKDRVVAANYAHIHGTTPHYEYEYRLRHKDGSYRWILARGAALRDAQGKAYRMAGSHVDVTARRQTEQDLKESEERHDAVLAALPVGVLVLDAAGKVLSCNASAARLLGLAEDQVRGRPMLDLPWQGVRADGTLLPAEAFPAVVALRTGRALSGAVLGVRGPDGEVRWLAAHAQPLFQGGETTPYAVVVTLERVSHTPAAGPSLG
jgi:PAS domain S-box-containing protein